MTCLWSCPLTLHGEVPARHPAPGVFVSPCVLVLCVCFVGHYDGYGKVEWNLKHVTNF